MKPIGPEQIAWLAAYDAHLASPPPPGQTPPPGAPPQDNGGGGDLSPTGGTPPAPVPEEAGDKAQPPQAEIPVAAAPPLPPPPRPRGRPPKLPAPPKIESAAPTKPEPKRTAASDGDWRDKFRNAQHGRERICVEIAKVGVGLLGWMESQIAAAGAKPIVTAAELWGPIVLTVDQLLPPKVSLTPENEVALGSAALVTQRFMLRKKIAAAEKAATERGEHEGKLAEMKRRTEAAEQRYRDEQAVPAPAPAATADPVSVRKPDEPAPAPTPPHMQPVAAAYVPGVDVV